MMSVVDASPGLASLSNADLEHLCELSGGFAFEVGPDTGPTLLLGQPRFAFEAAAGEFRELYDFVIESARHPRPDGVYREPSYPYYGYAVHVLHRGAGGRLVFAGIPVALGNAQMLDAIPVGILRVSGLGHLTYANRAIETLTGYSEPELAGQKWRDLDLFNTEVLDALFSFFKIAEDPNQTFREEVTVVSPLGHRRQLILVAKALRGRKNAVREYLLTLSEIPEQRYSEVTP